MFGREMKDMPMAWITQKHSALGPRFQLLSLKRHLAPLGHQTADGQAPMGIQIVHNPGIPWHEWQALRHMLEMRDKVRRLPRGPQGPRNLPRGHSQRVDQHPGAMADVLVFTSLAPARLSWFGGRFALQHLHTGFFIAAADIEQVG